MTYQKKIIFLATVVIILTAVSCFYPKPIKVSIAAKPKDSLTVNVIPLVTENIDIMNEFIGYIIPIQSVELRPNVSGYIDKIYVSGGQEVKVGQPLVKIDQKEHKAQLDAATAAVIQSQADFDNAKRYYERMKKAGKKAVSAASVDEAKSKFYPLKQP
ncbi:MAG: biotin/lipoyl-binding protein [Alphaproteobacteria bacterium]|nr:biotin/lipoyl-binding protein [Alphaproteobacteria bacterium]